MPAFPETVRIIEVGPRDGLQNVSDQVSTPDKCRFIELLAESGLQEIEATSFVHPKSVPQLADAEAVVEALKERPGLRYSCLVPNLRGLDRAIETGISRVAIFTAASETFNKRNINMGINESIEAFKPVVQKALQANLSVRGYVSTCWVCPYEGTVSKEKVLPIIERLFELGVDEVSVGDTIGGATPNEVETTLNYLLPILGHQRLAMHFHDTYGMAVANAYQSLLMGITTFDSSSGGLGGCPYAPGALGNVATEDLLYLFDRLGIKTGVHLKALKRASKFISKAIGQTLPSRVLRTSVGKEIH